MIYVASLTIPVKKALGKDVMQSNINRICNQINLDPDTTNMDVVILGPRDVQGPRRKQVQTALKGKHPDVCVIYIYEKEAEKDLIKCDYKKGCRKIRENVITEAFEEFVGAHKMHTGKMKASSADFEVPDADAIDKLDVRKTRTIKAKPGTKGTAASKANKMASPEDFTDSEDFIVDGQSKVIKTAKIKTIVNGATVYVEEPVTPTDDGNYITASGKVITVGDHTVTPEGQIIVDDVNIEELNIPAEDNSMYTEAEKKPMTTDTSVHDPLHAPDHLLTESGTGEKVEDYLARLKSFSDWEIFKEQLNRDTIVKHLINENSEYVGLVNILDVLDKRIETVWRDPALSAEQKFEKIKSIGLERSVVRASTNSIYVEKVIGIISTIALSAKRTVEDKINSLDIALYKISTDKAAIADTTYIDKIIEERTSVQLELLNISRGIVDIYKAMDDLVTDGIMELDRKLPSANQFINEMVRPVGVQIFTPQNTAELANKMMQALQSNRIVASQLEDSINACIDKLFELCEKDEEIILYQQNMINLLKAHRVEDVIISHTLLKRTLRLFTGADNTGRSATAITWCGILARRQNSLLLDLTGRDKFNDYGITPIQLEDFMANRVEQPFLCVTTQKKLSPEEIADLITELKTRLNYYPFINIIVAPEDEAIIDQLSEEALSIHYITNCTTESMRIMKETIKKHTYSNIARKLITIDAPISPLAISDSLGVDPTLVKLITIPNVPALRACSLRHDRPYEYNDVVKIYEEAFR